MGVFTRVQLCIHCVVIDTFNDYNGSDLYCFYFGVIVSSQWYSSLLYCGDDHVHTPHQRLRKNLNSHVMQAKSMKKNGYKMSSYVIKVWNHATIFFAVRNDSLDFIQMNFNNRFLEPLTAKNRHLLKFHYYRKVNESRRLKKPTLNFCKNNNNNSRTYGLSRVWSN